jgi:hypothetical protein
LFAKTQNREAGMIAAEVHRYSKFRRRPMLFDTIHQILDIAAPLVAIVGVTIALIQLRGQNRLRQMDTVMRMYSSFGQESFLAHHHRVMNWKYDTFEAFKKKATEEDNVSLMVVSVFFENMGLLYKRGLAPLDLLDDLLSGPITSTWRKVKPLWVGLRAEYGQPQWAEWFELLSEDMVKRLAQLEKKK